ncbi:MAG: endo-1,4-beta-xylanase, partial [Prolixibacteraceae bacterium]|nr:endo-1,4-beta-xylanase [Prolixibacteraceae bacterium]
MKKVQLLSCLLLSIHFLYAQEDNKKNGTSLATTNTSFDSNIKSITDAFGICHAGKTKSKGEYDLLDDLGIDWIRIDFRWDKIEKQKGNFDFTQMDQLVDSAILHNKKILGVICYDTPWIHEENKRKFYISPENQKDYINYVIKLTEHYKWKVPAFEIWNEPNNRLRK